MLQKDDGRVREPDRLRLLVTGVSTYAINLLSPDGEIVSWNAGAQRLKGYRADEVLGRNLEIFYTEDDRKACLPQLSLSTASAEGTFEVDAWRVRRDGSLFWGSVVIDAIRDSDRRLLGFVSITRDITERKLATQALRTGEESYKLLLDAVVADYAIFMLSGQGHVASWNEGAARLLGYTANEAVGAHISRFYTQNDQDVDIPMASLHAAALEGRFESEGWRIRADGARIWVNTVVEPVRNPKGALVGFAVVTRDTTEKRESERALERAKEQLFQAQKLDALGKLTAGVAHDFNNLLGVIEGAANLLARETLTPTGSRALDSLKRAAASGGALTRELLLFARHRPLKEEVQELNALVHSFEPVLRQMAHNRVDFQISPGPAKLPVLVDATQFEAALLNLVSNAVDAMPQGGRLTLSTETVVVADGEIGSLPAGRFAKIQVMDTGTGMTSEVAVRAVEPFFTTKASGKGTGMGLAQVLGLVQRVGGELRLDTVPEWGTTVSLYLPLLEASQERTVA